MNPLVPPPDHFHIARKRMIHEQLIRRGIADLRVLEAMGNSPRHLFVDQALAEQAYGDHPVSIGEGQTISQPYIVALMTEALRLNGSEKILEIGTGCGYQTSILATLGSQVFTIERIKLLALKARRILKNLSFTNIVMRVGDGTRGWEEEAPFDRILIAAGSPKIPQPLVTQLVLGGAMVVPVGKEGEQSLLRITKREDGTSPIEDLGACRFVKLVGKFGWHRQRSPGEHFRRRSRV